MPRKKPVDETEEFTATVLDFPAEKLPAPVVDEDEAEAVCSCCYNKVARAHNRLLAENARLVRQIEELERVH